MADPAWQKQYRKQFDIDGNGCIGPIEETMMKYDTDGSACFSPSEVKRIVHELDTHKTTSRNLFTAVFAQIAVLGLMTAVVFAAVMSGVELAKESHVHDGNLVALDNTPVTVDTIKTTQGLLSLAYVATQEFSHIKAATIVVDMAGDGDLNGDVEMTLGISGAYRSVERPRKVRVTTQQGHVLKVDGVAGTASIVIGNEEYEVHVDTDVSRRSRQRRRILQGQKDPDLSLSSSITFGGQISLGSSPTSPPDTSLLIIPEPKCLGEYTDFTFSGQTLNNLAGRESGAKEMRFTKAGESGGRSFDFVIRAKGGNYRGSQTLSGHKGANIVEINKLASEDRATFEFSFEDSETEEDITLKGFYITILGLDREVGISEEICVDDNQFSLKHSFIAGYNVYKDSKQISTKFQDVACDGGIGSSSVFAPRMLSRAGCNNIPSDPFALKVECGQPQAHRAVQLAFQDRKSFTLGFRVLCQDNQCGSGDTRAGVKRAICAKYTVSGQTKSCDDLKKENPTQTCKEIETKYNVDCYGCLSCEPSEYMDKVYSLTNAHRNLVFTGRSMLSDTCTKKTPQENICNCLNGTAATGDNCKVEGANTCARCDPGFFLGVPTTHHAYSYGPVGPQPPPSCIKHTDCDAVGKQTVSPGTSTSDTRCGGYNRCYCDNGIAAKDRHCPKHLFHKCETCSADHWLDTSQTRQDLRLGDGLCEPHTDCDQQGRLQTTTGTAVANTICGADKECKCKNGAPATGTSCTTHGSPHCISCTGKYYLKGDSCLPWLDCDASGKVVTQHASNAVNAKCGRAKQCKCDYGTGATGTACPIDGLAKCVACDKSYWLDTDHKCKKWTDCDVRGKQTATTGTPTADRTCGDIKRCKCAHGNGATSTDCPVHGAQMCSGCTGKFFLRGIACKAHTDCDAKGRVQTAPGTNTADALCGADKKCVCTGGVGATGTECPAEGASKCVVCSSKFYLANSVCKPHTDCDKKGKVQTTAGRSTSDAVCGVDKKCVCNHYYWNYKIRVGAEAVGTDCPRDGDVGCTSCLGQFFLDGITCKPHTSCNYFGKVQTIAGTNTNDAVCGALKNCTCANGRGATGTACPKQTDAKCVSCTGKYFLDGIQCMPWTDCTQASRILKTPGTNSVDAVCGGDFQCTCQNGVHATGALCPAHGSPKCISCTGKYYLKSDSCRPWRDCDNEGKVETQPASNTADAKCGLAKQCKCDHGTGTSGTACPTDGLAKCDACDKSYWLNADKCKQWTDCDALGKQTAKFGTSTADATCGAIKRCKCVHGNAATSTDCPLHDSPKCSSCTGKFFLFDDGACWPHSDCDYHGRVQITPGDNTADAVCGADKTCVCTDGVGATGTLCPADGASKCVHCSSNFYLDNGVCKPHTDCDKKGKVQTTAGKSTSDAVCGVDKKCVCDHGAHAVGTDCPRDGDAHCTSCQGKFFLDGITCKPHTNCNQLGKVQTTAGTTTNDAVCGDLKKCTCANGGVAATGTACPTDKDAKCVSCTGKYFLDGKQCMPWTDCLKASKTVKTTGTNSADAVCGGDFQCTCQNGVHATGALCPTDGSPKCISCTGKYYLKSDSCRPWRDCDNEGKVETEPASNTADAKCGLVKKCQCDHGTGAGSTACPTDGLAKCDACDDSYWLDAEKCKKWTDCDALGKVLQAPGTAKVDAQCGLEKACTCENGHPARGVKCPKNNAATCSNCDIGFYLEKFTCKPWTKCNDLGRVENLPGTAVADAICGSDKTCMCSNRGIPSTGVDCPKEGYRKCATCVGKSYLDGVNCKSHTDCNKLGKVELKAPTNIADAKCGAAKQCTCKHGSGATSTACPIDGNNKCVACNQSYWLDAHMCKLHTDCNLEGRAQKAAGTKTADTVCGDLRQCTCPNGIPARGTDCPKSNTLQCTSCAVGFFKFLTECKRHRNCDAEGRLLLIPGTSTTDTECAGDKQCTCDKNGIGATGTKCPTHNTAYCGVCSVSHWLNSGKCTPRTNCDLQGKIELEAGGIATDTTCGRQKICTCTFGEGATGKNCPADNMAYCGACLHPYYLWGGKCRRPLSPRTTTTKLLRKITTTTEVVNKKVPPAVVVGITVPILLLLLILVGAAVLGIVCFLRSKGQGDYTILVAVPNTAMPRLGNKLDKEGRLIIFTTPRCRVGTLAEKIEAALANVSNSPPMSLRLAKGGGQQAPLLTEGNILPADKTLKELSIPSGSVVEIIASADARYPTYM